MRILDLLTTFFRALSNKLVGSTSAPKNFTSKTSLNTASSVTEDVSISAPSSSVMASLVEKSPVENSLTIKFLPAVADSTYKLDNLPNLQHLVTSENLSSQDQLGQNQSLQYLPKLTNLGSTMSLLRLLGIGVSLTAGFGVSMVNPALAYEKDKVYHYTVLHIANIQGNYWPDDLGQGGLAYIKQIVEEIRDEEGAENVLFFDAGGYTTIDLSPSVFKNIPYIESLNDIGTDAVALARMDLMRSVADLKKQRQLLKAPVISANVKYFPTNSYEEEELFSEYVQIKRAGLNFLVTGVTNTDFKVGTKIEVPPNFVTYDPAEMFQTAMEKGKVAYPETDVIIGLNHLTFYPLGNHGSLPYGDFTIAQSLKSRSVSLMITANQNSYSCVENFGQNMNYDPSKKCIPPYSNLIPIVSSYREGLYVGRADFKFVNGVATMEDYQLIPVNVKRLSAGGRYVNVGQEVSADPELQAKLENFYLEDLKALNEVVGDMPVTLAYDATNPESLEKLGRFVAYAQRTVTDSDISLVITNDLRAGIAKGKVTYADLKSVLRNDVPLSRVDLSGRELHGYLQRVLTIAANNNIIPVFSGVTFNYDRNLGFVKNIKIHGNSINVQAVYSLTISNDIANGLYGLPTIAKQSSFRYTDYTSLTSLQYYFHDDKHKLSKKQLESNNY